MVVSQFAFLQHEWPGVFEAAGKAEMVVHADPRTACFYARRPLIFYSNGYEHWPWDDASYPPRQVQGFH
jgi:type I restriction enzyme R subunit